MHLRLKILFIVSCLSVVMCMGVVIAVSVQYQALSINSSTLPSLAPNGDKVILKINDLLEGHKHKNYIVKEFKSQNTHNLSIHRALASVSADYMSNVFVNIVVWCFVSVVFGVIALFLQYMMRDARAAEYNHAQRG